MINNKTLTVYQISKYQKLYNKILLNKNSHVYIIFVYILQTTGQRNNGPFSFQAIGIFLGILIWPNPPLQQ